MTRVWIAFAFLCVVFGTTFGAIAIGIAAGWPPLLAAGVRFTAAGAIVLAVAGARGLLRRPTNSETRGIAAIGLTVTAGTFAALYRAECVLPSGLAAVLSASSPLFAVGLAVASGRRGVDAFVVTGLALGTIGVVLVAGVGSVNGPVAALAAFAIVVSEIGFAWGLAHTRTVARTVPLIALAGAQQLVGGVALLGLSLAVEHRLPAHVDATGVLALVYLILVGSAAGHSVSLWLASVTDATFASSWTYVSPFVALVVGAVYLHEPIGVTAWLGGACVVAGALALNRNATFLKSERPRQLRARDGRA